jgi:hypothetical protein
MYISVSDLLHGLYAFNPQPILDNLQKFIEKMEKMSYADRVIVVTLLMEVSGKQPKVNNLFLLC